MLLEKLNWIADVLLKEELDYQELSLAINEYKDLLLSLSNIDLEEDALRSDIHFENGKALGTTWAAMCVEDIQRTKRFVKGLDEAIKQIKKGKDNTIHILYAGTGPFATIALPLMTRYTEADIQFIFLEINGNSFASVKRVINALGFSGYLKSLEQADATKYKIDPSDHIDIVLSETMQHGLKKEQQVPIVINLIKQLSDDVILIPERIELKLGLLNPSRYEDQSEGAYFKNMGEVFQLSKESIKSFGLMPDNLEDWRFPEKSFYLTPSDMNGFNLLAILTEIQVFGEEKLSGMNSGLTIPIRIKELSNHEESLEIKMRYVVDEEPGLKYTIN